MAHEFELSKEIELAATPEQVWDAIATGPGIDSWFMGRTEIEPREGGRGRFTMMGGVEQSTVTAWKPGERFAYRSDESPGGAFMALDYLIEGRGGGSTVLRLVQSGVLGDDWESEYEALGVGWDMYLHTLAQYLAHFPGRTTTGIVSAARPKAGDPEQVWTALTGALELSGPIAQGAPVRLAVEGLPAIEGVVDYAGLPTFLGVRTGDGLYRFIHSGPSRGNALVLGHHIFSDDVDEQTAETAWNSWLDRLLA
ncbi:SRPBCC family protein [Sphaerimonospora sp. CA-214678]|uniref:SRPBCC family protein n=1 Tax=Sphaerimonospora sp. CA-214678 TaxID=3240029 RepID=UPI003D8E5BC8